MLLYTNIILCLDHKVLDRTKGGGLLEDEERAWSTSYNGMDSQLRSIGIYKGGKVHFTFVIGPNYPHEPPKVLCTQKVGLYLHTRQLVEPVGDES